MRQGKLFPADYITIANATLGTLALFLVSMGYFVPGMVLVVVTMVLDMVDGRVARAFGGSIYGGDLDSFSDIVGFGVVPAVILFKVLGGFTGLVLGSVWLLAGILRLARYNVIKTKDFIGLPLSLAALAVMFAVYINISQSMLIAVGLFFAFLMVSNIKVKKF